MNARELIQEAIAALKAIVEKYHREGWIAYEEIEAIQKRLERLS